MRNLVCIVLCLVAGTGIRANAYEVGTHISLTQAATDRSRLRLDPALLLDLGLMAIDDSRQQFPNSRNDSLTVEGLLQDGAQFEDSFISFISTFRPLRHFYNPVTGLGLDVPFLPTQTSSPDWALARPGAVSSQDFSYGNARQSLFDALTKTAEEQRKAAFGRTFQTLGQVVHHLQDMAQPQHVRNDAHCDQFVLCGAFGAYAPSLYESWTNDNRGTLPTDFSVWGYDITSSTFISTFNSPRRFWHTESPGPNSPVAGKGIAEFTNRNFVSAGTNFGTSSGGFVFPVYDGSTQFDMDIQDLCANAIPPCPNRNLSGPITFVTNPVTDNYAGTTVDNPFASSFSIFDADLRNVVGQPRLFTLNRFTFSLANAFLIPRAVAYSAGMINYFFRGKIDLVEDDDNPGNYFLKNLSNEPMTGTFALYYDYDDASAGTVNNRKLLKSWDKTIPANGQESVGTIPVPIDPEPRNPDEFMLVFAGDMGQETRAEFGTAGAVAGKMVTLTPVRLFAALWGVSETAPIETSMEFNFSFPEKYAQKIRSNPTAFSIQIGAVTTSPTFIDANSACFLFLFQIFQSHDCVDMASGDQSWRFFLTQDNKFVTWFPGEGILLAGTSPETLTPASRDMLCGGTVVNGNSVQGAPLIDSTKLDLITLEGAPTLVSIKVRFEGKVLFEFDALRGPNNALIAQPNTFETILSNARNIRLTKVRCRVNAQ